MRQIDKDKVQIDRQIRIKIGIDIWLRQMRQIDKAQIDRYIGIKNGIDIGLDRLDRQIDKDKALIDRQIRIKNGKDR